MRSPLGRGYFEGGSPGGWGSVHHALSVCSGFGRRRAMMGFGKWCQVRRPNCAFGAAFLGAWASLPATRTGFARAGSRAPGGNATWTTGLGMIAQIPYDAR